jgi:hypothetical protein
VTLPKAIECRRHFKDSPPVTAVAIGKRDAVVICAGHPGAAVFGETPVDAR